MYSKPFSPEDIGIGFLFAGIVMAFAMIASQQSSERNVIIGAVAAKLVVSVLFGIYNLTGWQGGDVISYHYFGVTLAGVLVDDMSRGTTHFIDNYPFYSTAVGNATTRMQGLSGVVHLLVSGSFLASSFVFALFGFAGQFMAYRALVTMYPSPAIRQWWRIGILFMPSFTFWCSGLTKDPLGVLGVGCVLWGSYCILSRGQLLHLFTVVFGIYVVLLFRTQATLPLVAAMVPWYMQSHRAQAQGRQSAGRPLPIFFRLLLGAMALFFLNATLGSQTQYSLDELPTTLTTQRETMESIQGAGSTDTDVAPQQRSWGGLVSAWPMAALTTLYRPLLWEGFGSGPMFLAALENLVLLVLSLRTLRRLFGDTTLTRSFLGSPFVISALLFVALFTLGLGVSTPNLGNISRYRLPMLPFFIAVLAIAEDLYQLRRRSVQQEHLAKFIRPVVVTPRSGREQLQRMPAPRWPHGGPAV